MLCSPEVDSADQLPHTFSKLNTSIFRIQARAAVICQGMQQLSLTSSLLTSLPGDEPCLVAREAGRREVGGGGGGDHVCKWAPLACL